MPRVAKLVISCLVTFAIMCAIFSLSGQDGGESGSLSTMVSTFIATHLVDGFARWDPLEQERLIEAMAWPIRKTAHAGEYACLAVSLIMSCWQAHALALDRRPATSPLSKRIVVIGAIAFLIAVLYACTDELHQLFVDGRAGQASDVLVDASGAFLGAALASLTCFLFSRRNSKR